MSKAAVHEVGHWISLSHTFEGDTSSTLNAPAANGMDYFVHDTIHRRVQGPWKSSNNVLV